MQPDERSATRDPGPPSTEDSVIQTIPTGYIPCRHGVLLAGAFNRSQIPLERESCMASIVQQWRRMSSTSRVCAMRSVSVVTLMSALFAGDATGDPQVGPSAEACVDCHLEKTVMSHPVGIQPPHGGKALPMAADGTISCGTCHGLEPHAASSTSVRTARSRCEVCHESGGHGGEAALAHMVRIDEWGRPGLSKLSTRCASCHDGAIAPAAHVRFVSGPRPRHQKAGFDGLRSGHPIGMRYSQSVAAKSRGYRRVSDLPPGILFEDGAVGCGSCHDLFSDQASRLVYENTGSALCLTCHAKTPRPPSLQPNPRYTMLQAISSIEG